MAFVPPVAGYGRDRARSEAFSRKHYVIEEESETSRRSSLLAVKRTVENTLPPWFETGFPEFDTRLGNPFADTQSSHQGYYGADSQKADNAGPSNVSRGGHADERELLSRYSCDEFEVSQFSGEGRIAFSRKSGAKVAIRRILKDTTGISNDARREITILSLVTDPSLPSLIEWLETSDAIWTVKEYRPYQTLAEYVALNGPLPETVLKVALNQLFSGITSLFLAGFAHLRICPDTVCFDEQQQIVIKDLHSSCVYGKEKVGNYYAPTQEKHGSDIYVAPEVFANHTYNARKAVMWSCGILLYFMITGQTERLNNIEHPTFEKTLPPLVDPAAAEAEQQYPSSSKNNANHYRKLSLSHAKSKIILYPDRFSVPNYARAIIPKMLITNPIRRAELIEVATRVPKDFAAANEKQARPLISLAWVDYKAHVGPYAGMDIGAGGAEVGGWSGGILQSSASSIMSAASGWSNPLGSLMGRGHVRRRSEPVTSRFTRYA